MPLVPAKCPNCGDTVNVDSQKDAAICTSCGSAFIVEKAISNYNINIKADIIEINNDGVTADNLLQLASDDIGSGNYAKAANYLARVLERDTSNPLLRPVRIFCNVIAGIAIDSIPPAKLQETCQLAKETYSLLGKRQEQGEKHQYDDIFSQAVFNANLELFNCFTEQNAEALQEEESWADTSQQYLQCAQIIDEFISWGQNSGYFSASDDPALPQGRQIQGWAACIIDCLQKVSLCYHEDMSLSRQQAQFCYDMAAKYQPLSKKELDIILIPPYQGGEGIHSHILYDEQTSYSISDQRYYSQAILNGPPPELKDSDGSSNDSNSVSCSFAMAGCVSVILYFAVVPPLLDEARRNHGTGWGAVFYLSAFLVLIVPFVAWLIGKINSDHEEKKSYRELIKQLYPQWKTSPAQGTEAKALDFSCFVSSLEAQAQDRIKELQLK